MALVEPVEQTVQKLIEAADWEGDVGFKPIVSTGWYNALKPNDDQVTVSTGMVIPSFYILDSKQREFLEMVEVNVWSLDETHRWQMVHYIDELIQEARLSMGTGLVFSWVGSWTPLDDPQKGPLHRTRLYAYVAYYKTSEA